MVTTFPKLLLPTVTLLILPGLFFCCAVVYYEKVEIFLCSDNLLQVTSLWSDMIEAHIHLILANQNLTEVLLIFFISSLKHAGIV